MELPKTNKHKFISWLLLGLFGYLVNYFIIKPATYDWSKSIVFADDLPNGVLQLLIAEILMIPAFTVALLALIQAVKEKNIVWIILHLIGLLILSWLIMYFAVPIIFPPRGL